eukprot:tig00020848_g14559.t1
MASGAHRAPWKALVDASLEANRDSASRFLQLATMRESGHPANRTVVFRGWRKSDETQLLFVTDRRSEKVKEIRRCAWSEVCWYFPKTREQYRITGTLQAVAEGDSELAEERAEIWRTVSEATRAQFTWPASGLPVDPVKGWSPSPEPPHPTVPAADFVLLILTPTSVDWLTLTPPARQLFHPDPARPGSWVGQHVNP